MGSIIGKGQSAVTGYRYYFAVLAGICRGPVDEIFLIKSADNILFDGTPNGSYSQLSGDAVDLSITAANDPEPPDVSYVGDATGTITDNTMTILSHPDLYGGDEREGGVTGYLWVYMGAKDQLIAAADWIRTAMAGLFLPAMRGVVTTFFDGEVTANNPYPKAWKYRVRRALKGWDGDVWYPEKAVITMTDSAIPQYSRGVGDTGSMVTTEVYSPGEIDSTGASTGSGTQTQVTSNYAGATITTYNASGTISTVYAVPIEYNDIKAMNPAHIIYETCTNRDWGRGMSRALISHASFAAAADTLYSEGFGMCLKWSRTEDVDAFLQTVIDHIGAVLYTDRITGLLSIRLIRNDYDPASLSVFDYNSGLVEVTSVDTAANDTTPNEVIVKYHTPVLDDDKEARQQDLASINQLGCTYSVTKDYSGLPTSDLAIRVAARDLRALGAWKKVEFTLDRRGYRVTPGDCLIVNAPDRGLYSTVIRVATIEDSVMTDGTIKVVGSQDTFGLPATGLSNVEPSQWLAIDNTPKPCTDQFAVEATYYDVYRTLANNPSMFEDIAADPLVGYQAIFATKPTPSSLNFKIWEQKRIHFTSTITDFQNTGTGAFSRYATLLSPVGISDTTLTLSSGLDPRIVAIPQTMLLIGNNTYDRYAAQEIVYVTALAKNALGQYVATVKRGCVDTVAIPHVAGARLFNYSETATIDLTEYTFNDIAVSALVTHTTRGDLPAPASVGFWAYPTTICAFGARMGKPYPGSDFRLNGYVRDEMPTVDPGTVSTIVATWKHRNKATQADQLFGESDGSVSPPSGIEYHLYFFSLSNYGAFYYAGFSTSETLTVNSSDLVTAGLSNQLLRATLSTQLPSAGSIWAEGAWTTPECVFQFGAPPPPATSGFDAQFDLNFGG